MFLQSQFKELRYRTFEYKQKYKVACTECGQEWQISAKNNASKTNILPRMLLEKNTTWGILEHLRRSISLVSPIFLLHAFRGPFHTCFAEHYKMRMA